jgi:hypothetical protein
MSMALEYIKNAIRDEAAAHRQNVTVCMPMLMSTKKTQWLHQVEMLPARVIATYRRRRSSSICSGLPTAISEGMQPSVTLSTNTTSHSCPLAEWIVDRTR